jgi:hypothetical protein
MRSDSRRTKPDTDQRRFPPDLAGKFDATQLEQTLRTFGNGAKTGQITRLWVWSRTSKTRFQTGIFALKFAHADQILGPSCPKQRRCDTL